MSNIAVACYTAPRVQPLSYSESTSLSQDALNTFLIIDPMASSKITGLARLQDDVTSSPDILERQVMR